ncbi:uncharacterized protein MONBRDRAFT_7334 [Monosiga brevicollis MX1]|uniref:Uncharacterized protein n=1 Tax=Monosiga brevicollis TaxID=81824 RepID=A9UWN1_MONBE|nr:uncharacterized protein MONBRDRAFT_7334 [Monosiga brevicollis MX1]EDQ90243.1 predicted protein [Monosiga brevicollis MX1]|eukprot:XP_001745010.1 hypothetical protein [Monosiga brevicollis MX1]
MVDDKLFTERFGYAVLAIAQSLHPNHPQHILGWLVLNLLVYGTVALGGRDPFSIFFILCAAGAVLLHLLMSHQRRCEHNDRPITAQEHEMLDTVQARLETLHNCYQITIQTLNPFKPVNVSQTKERSQALKLALVAVALALLSLRFSATLILLVAVNAMAIYVLDLDLVSTSIRLKNWVQHHLPHAGRH